MALTANIERFRVQEWIADLRLGGSGGARLRFAGNCRKPVELFCRGLPDKLMNSLGLEPETQRVAWLEARCRKCEPCLTNRSQLWAARCRDELRIAGRTWFCTLTLAPAQLVRARFAAESRLAERGHILSEVSEDAMFLATSREVSPELTRWLKRIRKNSGARLRYLLVCEAHESGAPHWHLMVHEKIGRVTKRELEASWRYGLSHFRLIDPNDEDAAFYVAKYLSKSALTRVRASQNYGAPPVSSVAEQLERLVSLLTRGKREGERPCEIGVP